MYSRYNKNNINKFNNLQIKLIKNFFLKLSVLVICLFFSLCIFYDESMQHRLLYQKNILKLVNWH